MNMRHCILHCWKSRVAQKCQSVNLWLLTLFLTTLFTLLFILCFIHFLKDNHAPPIVPNDLQDYSTTKSIYFLLSFYFLLWTVVYMGGIIFTVIPKKYGHSPLYAPKDKPGRTLLIVLLILLGIITILLFTIDRVYSPWILNFLRGKIFSYCVQVAALITLTVGLCYLFAILTVGFCSTNQNIKDQLNIKNNKGSLSTTSSASAHLSIRKQDAKMNKHSFDNPCYNVEFVVTDLSSITSKVTEPTQV